MLVSCLLVLIGLALLVYGADIFVVGASSLARRLGISPLIIGLTIVGFATSAPEIIVGAVSALQDKTAIAIGNALGSNITNIGLVLGASVLILPMPVASNTLKREYGLMCAAIVLGVILMSDQYLGRFDGLILVAALCLSIGWVVWLAKHSKPDDPLKDEFAEELKTVDSVGIASFKLILGLGLLLGGAHLLVKGAVFIAQYFGVSDLVIGLTIVAIGTSLPELAASIASLLKKEPDIAIGNIIGSNMFNMLAVLGIPTLINPDTFEHAVLTRDIPAMAGLTLLLGAMVFLTKKNKLIRSEGAILLLCFCIYQYILYTQSISNV